MSKTRNGADSSQFEDQDSANSLLSDKAPVATDTHSETALSRTSKDLLASAATMGGIGGAALLAGATTVDSVVSNIANAVCKVKAIDAQTECFKYKVDAEKETEQTKLKYLHEAQMRELDIKEKERLKVRCSECPASFENTKDLTAHVKAHHTEKMKIQCTTDGCNSMFETLKMLEEHKKNIHGGWSKMDECPYPECAGTCFKNRDACLKHLSSAHRYS